MVVCFFFCFFVDWEYMKKKKNAGLIAVLVLVLVIAADQVLKIWIKTNMFLGEEYIILDWFRIHFVENNGMAFGMEVSGGKLFLSLFRIIAVGFIGYYLYSLVKKGYKTGYIACIALILAGAFGNIIDCVFYGEIFSASYPGVGGIAHFVPLGEGYSSWLHGKVVDMFSFPLFSGTFPDWFPLWGGESFVFFNAIFNVADAAITVGIFILILFYRKTLSHSLEKKDNTK